MPYKALSIGDIFRKNLLIKTYTLLVIICKLLSNVKYRLFFYLLNKQGIKNPYFKIILLFLLIQQLQLLLFLEDECYFIFIYIIKIECHSLSKCRAARSLCESVKCECVYGSDIAKYGERGTRSGTAAGGKEDEEETGIGCPSGRRWFAGGPVVVCFE